MPSAHVYAYAYAEAVAGGTEMSHVAEDMYIEPEGDTELALKAVNEDRFNTSANADEWLGGVSPLLLSNGGVALRVDEAVGVSEQTLSFEDR